MRLHGAASSRLERLTRELAGRQLIVVSNREPLIHESDPHGGIVARRPISGLVTALDPVMRALGGTWIARGAGSADRDTVDTADHTTVEDARGRYTLRRIWLTRAEERGHYDGSSNAGLWPLCHLAFEPPKFRRSDWIQYEEVNRRFADAVVAEARGPAPLVFVQDYHFALLPRLVRERLPNATIASFWHIPWPNRSRFERFPYAAAVLEAMLAADLLGFQTHEHAQQFLDCVQGVPDATVDPATPSVTFNGAETAVAAFPISVEFPSRWARSAPSPAECRHETITRFALPADSRIVLSVDRLDYTKGIEERLASIRRLLSRGAAEGSRPVFIQVAAPSRMRVDSYRAFAARVRAQVVAINERFSDPGYTPVVWIEGQVEPERVFRLYRAADVCHVNSLDDGMNLVSKEFVAARDDERGVLVLSRFTGAARDLDGAIAVDPYDLDASADAIAEALRMPHVEQAARMRSMRACLRGHDVFHWAEGILVPAAAARTVPLRLTTTVFPG